VRTDCELARERLSLQLDDELSAHEALLLERHLDLCDACSAFAFDVRNDTELLRTEPLEPAPQVWLGGRRPAATRFAARVAAVTAAAAAAVLVAVSTVSVESGARQSSAGFGYWPVGVAVRQHGDGNLGVQRVALGPRTPAAPAAGPRRGSVSPQLAS
jgi:predicted anti-sigma-YlaC factor YlaD